MRHVKKRRWKAEVEIRASKYYEIVVRIQRAFRWRRRWGLVIEYISKRRKSAVRIQKFYRRLRLYKAVRQVMTERHTSRLRLQRAVKLNIRHRLVLREINRRIEFRRTIFEQGRESELPEITEVIEPIIDDEST